MVALFGVGFGCGDISVSSTDEDVGAVKVCVAGSYKCVDTDVHACSSDGTTFLFLTQCKKSETCDGGACVPTAGTSCSTGEWRCSPDEAAAMLCKGGKWNIEEECTKGCLDGHCK